MRLIAGLVASVFLSVPAVAQDTALKTRLAIDGQGNVIHDAVIVVHDGRIVSVRPNDGTPQGAREVDLTKFTVMPGLIDMHVHISAHFDESSRERPDLVARDAAILGMPAERLIAIFGSRELEPQVACEKQ